MAKFFKNFQKDAQHLMEYLLFLAGMVGILLVVASPHGVIRQKTEDAINSALETIKDENYVRTYAWQLMECTACSATCTEGNSSATGEETCEVVCMRADGEVMTDETLCTETKPDPTQPCVISCPVDCKLVEGTEWECETCEVIDPSICEPALCAEPNSCGKVGRQICKRDTIPAQNGGRSCEELGLEDTTELFCTPDENTCPESICGNRYVDPDESCDMDVFKEDLDECGDVGFDGGDLTCTDDCAFDTTECWTKNCEEWEDDKCGVNAEDLNGDELPCPDGEIRQNRECYADYSDGRHILLDFDPTDPDMTQCVPRDICDFDCDDKLNYTQWCDPLLYNQGLKNDEYTVTYVIHGECPAAPMEDVRCVARCPYDENNLVVGGSTCCQSGFVWDGEKCFCDTSGPEDNRYVCTDCPPGSY